MSELDSEAAAREGRGRVAVDVVVVTAVVALVPVVAAVVAWLGGWMPYGDEAAITAQTTNVFSAHPPLLGVYSSATTATGSSVVLYHPGALQLWLLAPLAWLTAPSEAGVLLGSGLIVSACCVVPLVVAWRRAGRWVFHAVAVMLLWWMYTGGAQFLRSPHADGTGVFALLAFAAAAWAVADRDDRFWPVLVVAGSLAVQTQVANALPVVAVVVTVVVMVVGLRGIRFRARRDPVGAQGSGVRIGVVSGLLALVCWIGPLYDQFFGSGNLWQLVSAGGATDAIGLRWGWNRLVDTFALPPSWVRGNGRAHGAITGDGTIVFHNNGWEQLSALVVATTFVAVLVCAIRARRRVWVALGAATVGVMVGSVFASSLMPADPTSLMGHIRFWRLAGLLSWVTIIGFGVERLVTFLRSVAPRSLPALRRAALGAVGVAVVVPVVVALASSSPSRDFASVTYGAVRHLGDSVVELCEDAPGGVLIGRDRLDVGLVALGVIARARAHGCVVHVAPPIDRVLPDVGFRRTGDEDVEVFVSVSAKPPAGFHRVDVYDPTDPADRYRGFNGSYVREQDVTPIHLHARG